MAGSNAPEVFEAAEHRLDDVTSFVGAFVVAMGMLAGRVWRDDCPDPSLREFLAQAVGVIGPVGKNSFRTMTHCEQATGSDEVVDVAGRDQQNVGAADIIGQRVDFGRLTAA